MTHHQSHMGEPWTAAYTSHGVVDHDTMTASRTLDGNHRASQRLDYSDSHMRITGTRVADQPAG